MQSSKGHNGQKIQDRWGRASRLTDAVTFAVVDEPDRRLLVLSSQNKSRSCRAAFADVQEPFSLIASCSPRPGPLARPKSRSLS
ncbi:MAG: hypothetical protein HYR94_03035 [Chloroflexi bacterium]|nr:hypothetical protein [Chloroflexota bacterium]